MRTKVTYSLKNDMMKELYEARNLVQMHENNEIKVGFCFIVLTILTSLIYTVVTIFSNSINPLAFDLFIATSIGFYGAVGSTLVADGITRKKKLMSEVNSLLSEIISSESMEDWECICGKLPNVNFVKEALLFQFKQNRHIDGWKFIDISKIKTFKKGGEENDK